MRTVQEHVNQVGFVNSQRVVGVHDSLNLNIVIESTKKIIRILHIFVKNYFTVFLLVYKLFIYFYTLALTVC